MHTVTRRFAFLASALSVMACAPTAPSPPDLSGLWVGTISTPDHGSGTITLTLSAGPNTPPRAGDHLGGHWTLSFADTSKNGNGGVDGDFIGSSIGIGLNNTQPCSYGLLGGLNGPGSMSGKVTAGNCPAIQTTGSFALSRSGAQ